jgi:hypothetical protein
MTQTKSSKGEWTADQAGQEQAERPQTYRGYRIEVSMLGCQVPRILVFCETIAQAKLHIDSHIGMLDARR